MGKLTSDELKHMPDSNFAAVYTTPQRKNGRTSLIKTRKYPIHDAAHVRDALARFGQEQPPLPPHIKAKAKAKIHAAAKKHGIEAAVDKAEAAKPGKTSPGAGID